MLEVEESRRLQSIIVTAARLLSAFVGIAIPMVVVRVVDQRTFGVYKQLFLVAETLLMLLGANLATSLYYLVPRNRERAGRVMRQTAALLGGMGAVAAATVLLGADALSRFFDAPLAPYALALALFTALSFPAALFPPAPIADGRAKLAALVLPGFDLLRSAAIVLVAIATRSLQAIVLAAALAIGVQAMAGVAYALWRGRQDRPGARGDGLMSTQLAYVLPFAATTMVGLGRDKLHAFFVAGSFSAEEFAVYAVAILNLPFIGQLTQSVGEVLVVANAAHFAEGRLDELRRVWHRATYALALALFPIFALVEAFAAELITVLFGTAYVTATPIFRVYAVVVPLSVLLGSAMLRAAGDAKATLHADLSSLAVTIGVLLLTAPTLGPMGAALSLVAGQLAFAVYASWRTARRIELPARDYLPWSGLVKVLAVAGLAAYAAWWTGQLVFPGSPAARLFIAGGFGGLLFLAVAWVLGLVPEAEREMVKGFARRLPWARRTMSRLE